MSDIFDDSSSWQRLNTPMPLDPAISEHVRGRFHDINTVFMVMLATIQTLQADVERGTKKVDKLFNICLTLLGGIVTALIVLVLSSGSGNGIPNVK